MSFCATEAAGCEFGSERWEQGDFYYQMFKGNEQLSSLSLLLSLLSFFCYFKLSIGSLRLLGSCI